jgi:hypothetical protein
VENRWKNGRVRFFRLGRLHAKDGPRSSRHSRNPRRLGRLLEERQLALAALQTDLRLLWRSERFALGTEAPAREAQCEPFQQARGCR